jgi:hypothetical protein
LATVEGGHRNNRDYAYRRLLPGRERHALQTQFPSSATELRDSTQFRLLSFHSISITAAAASPSATPSNGLSAANQKEMSQSEFSKFGFLLTLFSQAFETDISEIWSYSANPSHVSIHTIVPQMFSCARLKK